MIENVTISQLEEIATKYSLQIHHWGWTTRFDLKIDSGGLLLARIDYSQADDIIMNIQMPNSYMLSFRGDKMRYIMTEGWVTIQSLNDFEKHTKELIENFKKCLVEQRKDFLEKDFD
jgi:hypothetical protein